MRKISLSLIMVLVLLMSMAVPAMADDLTGDSGWTVEFDGSKLNSSFSSGDMTRAAAGLQPGDSITFTVTLTNGYSASTDWWMTNKVLESFEDNSAANGGAYTYRLTYIDSTGEVNELYSSETVGGESTQGGEGLHQATGALEDYFYLDTLTSGSSGTITLEVALDGETQGNDYQDTLASMQMNFAVELTSTSSDPGGTTSNYKPVKTGDETAIVPYVILMGVCGVGVLVVAIISLKKSRKKEDE